MTDAMVKEYAAVGFSFDDFDDLMETLMDKTGGRAFSVPGFEGAVVYQDPAGPRLTAFKSNEGWQVTPGFSSHLLVDASLFTINEFLIHVDLRRVFGGKVLASLAAASDEAFAIPGGSPAVEGKHLRIKDAQLSLWGTDLTLYDSVADWQDSPDSFESLGEDGARTKTPTLLYSPSTEQFHKDFNPRKVGPYCHLSAKLDSVDTRTNSLTGQEFLFATTYTPAGKLPILLPADSASLSGAAPAPGMVFEGKVFASAAAGFWRRALS